MSVRLTLFRARMYMYTAAAAPACPSDDDLLAEYYVKLKGEPKCSTYSLIPRFYTKVSLPL